MSHANVNCEINCEIRSSVFAFMAIDSRLKDRELKDRKGCYVILVCIGSTNICTLGYTPILPIDIV